MSTLAGVVQPVVFDFLDALTAPSAGAALLATGLQLDFGGAQSISIPGFGAAAAGGVGWVAETSPIAVHALNSTGGPILTPKKLAILAVLTSEMLASSNADALIRDVLTQSTALALDAALFDTGAGDATRPPGLRNGISGLIAGTSADADLAALFGSIAPVAGNAPVALVADVAHSAKLKFRAGGPPPISDAADRGNMGWLAPLAYFDALFNSALVRLLNSVKGRPMFRVGCARAKSRRLYRALRPL